jgi:hypothetical protein
MFRAVVARAYNGGQGYGDLWPTTEKGRARRPSPQLFTLCYGVTALLIAWVAVGPRRESAEKPAAPKETDF